MQINKKRWNSQNFWGEKYKKVNYFAHKPPSLHVLHKNTDRYSYESSICVLSNIDKFLPVFVYTFYLLFSTIFANNVSILFVEKGSPTINTLSLSFITK